jgi:hypothetical protein
MSSHSLLSIWMNTLLCHLNPMLHLLTFVIYKCKLPSCLGESLLTSMLWAPCEELLHTFNIQICTHKTRLEVELLCNCCLTSTVVQGSAMCCVHLEDTKTLWENRNSPWWNMKVCWHSFNVMLDGWTIFVSFVITSTHNLII